MIRLELPVPLMPSQPSTATSCLSTPVLIERLADIVGTSHIISSADELAGWSADIYREGVRAELVVSPATVEEVASVVRACTDAGRAVIPLGGGFSYTGGYLAVRPHTIVVSLHRLDRILEINTEDLYVSVEAGCTWKALFEALQAKGVRTPYFGPISGYASTVGGALSQGSFFMGSTQYGTTAESTLGLEVVLADGTLLRTGSGATTCRPSPWFRTYGPDLTGLFLGDTGALGFKVRATLQLIPLPTIHRYATHAFDGHAAVLRVVAEIARRGLAAECYAWDPYVVENFARRDVNVAEGLEYLAGVVKSGSTLFAGLRDAAGIAVAGKRLVQSAKYLVHVTVDETLDDAADAKIDAIERLLRAAGGVPAHPSVPRALRGMPFSYPNRILGLNGERWVPTNALVPHSRAPEVLEAFHAYMARNEDVIERFGVRFGIIFFAVGSNTLCIEPLLYWPDSRLPSHERLMQPDYLRTIPSQPDNAASRQAMHDLRLGMVDLFMRMGCAHVQIGKYYRYRDSRDPATWALLQSLKCILDPRGLVNPGSLGLQADRAPAGCTT